MVKLRKEIHISEFMRTFEDVELAYKRRGYVFTITHGTTGFCINATICNREGQEIKYEFTDDNAEKCYFMAAVFLKNVQLIRDDCGLEVY